jgi:CRP-like cAMP-binding protein
LQNEEPSAEHAGQSCSHSIPFAGHALDVRTFLYGEEITREGEDCPFFFVILTGQVRISQREKTVRLLSDLDVFGLENILLRHSSLYSSKTLCKSRIAVYGPEALDRFFGENQRMVKRVVVSLLHQLIETSFHLSRDFQTLYFGDGRVLFFKDGATITEEGSQGTDFYRLVTSQGGLSVSVGGKEVSRIEKPGEFFGEMAGLLQAPRQTTIKSIGESVVEAFSADDLDMIIRYHPRVALQMMRSLVFRFASVNSLLARGQL